MRAIRTEVVLEHIAKVLELSPLLIPAGPGEIQDLTDAVDAIIVDLNQYDGAPDWDDRVYRAFMEDLGGVVIKALMLDVAESRTT